MKAKTILALLAALLMLPAAPAASELDPTPAPGEPIAAAATRSGDCAVGRPDASTADLVAVSSGHAQLWRMYQAFFLREPDAGGLDYWVSIRNSGYGLAEIAYDFSTSAEFQLTYGSLSDEEFVALVYRNVLCRGSDAAGQAYWVGQLRSGGITRWNLVVNFTELGEYLTMTGTCRSLFAQESAALGHCDEGPFTPLSQASLGADGYEAFSAGVGSGSLQGVKVDVSRHVFSTGGDRCSVASINGNWLVPSQKDGPNPGVLGIGVVDGFHVRNSADRTDMGILGIRRDTDPTDVVEVWPGDTLSDDDPRLNSVLWHEGNLSLELWRASAEVSPYLTELVPHEIVSPDEWLWAASGIPLVVDGQADPAFDSAYYNDPYAFQTLRHSFVAMDQDTGILAFGATQSADARALRDWAVAAGYEDLIKFDGGASTEFNVGGYTTVAGTSRDIPVWLGIGC